MLLKRLDGIMNYCRTKVRFGVVEALNGNILMMINRGRGYQNLRYLLLKVKRTVVINVEFIAISTLKKAALEWHPLTNSRSEPFFRAIASIL